MMFARRSCVSGRSFGVPRMNIVMAAPTLFVHVDDEHLFRVTEEHRATLLGGQDRPHLSLHDGFVHKNEL